MSEKFVFFSQFYAIFRKNDFEYWSIIPLVQLPTFFYEIIVIFVNPFCTEIFIF